MAVAAVQLTTSNAMALRMASLLLRGRADQGGTGGTPPVPAVVDVVTWFGAMQAQDVGSALWSLGVRLPTFSTDDVLTAMERREALRTWPMRGTVHLVPPRDAHWMLDLMGARPLAGAAARRAYLGLTEQQADRGVEVLAAALSGGGRMTRAQCVAALAEGGVSADGQLGYHLLWYASQRAVTCIAPHVGKEQTFVLLDEWVPDPHRPDRDEALGTIALRYFRSHGPTTRQDFAGWTGLTAADAKHGIAVAGDDLATVQVDGTPMLMDPAVLDARDGVEPPAGADEWLVLPGFDEYLLGYKDRTLMLAPEHKQAIIPGGNGVFQSTVVRGGRVVATWKRSLAKGRTDVEVFPLLRLTRADRAKADRAFAGYARYTGLPLSMTWRG